MSLRVTVAVEPDPQFTYYSFDMGDGRHVTLHEPMVTYTYEAPGAYQIKVFGLDSYLNAGTPFIYNLTLNASPTIESITPNYGKAGDQITIHGSALASATAVSIGQASAAIVSNTDTEIVVTVPSGAVSGQLNVITHYGTAFGSVVYTFVQPSIQGIEPLQGPAGSIIKIYGTGLNYATKARINGVVAEIIDESSTSFITIQVPPDASTGTIEITTMGGSVTSTDVFTFIPAPVITSINTTIGGPGTQVVISGTGLYPVQGDQEWTVKFGGVPATFISVFLNTQIVCEAPEGALSGPITVTTLAGTAASEPFTFIARPTISSVSPLSGGTGTIVVLLGSHFVDVETVTFGDIEVIILEKLTSRITVELPANLPPSAQVQAIATGGIRSTAGIIFTFFAQPVITAVAGPGGIDTSVNIGDTVTVTGGGFYSPVVSLVNAGAITVNLINDSTFTFVVPSDADTGTITVDAAGGSATSPLPLEVNPVVSSVSSMTGGPSAIITFTGTALSGASVFFYNGTTSSIQASVTTNTFSSIVAIVPIGSVTGPIMVTTQAGSVTTGTFTVILPPTISNVTPTTIARGGTITITGTNVSAATVTIGGVACTVTSNTSTQVQITVSNQAVSGALVLTNVGGVVPYGTSITILPQPTITSFTPTAGAFNSIVLISGTNFSGGGVGLVSVTLGGTPLAIQSYSSTQIQAIVTGATQTASITVVTTGGSVTSAAQFTSIAPPTISLITPMTGKVGDQVVIDGSDLIFGPLSSTTVSFNGSNVTPQAGSTASRITVLVPSGATTGKITVTAPGGVVQSATNFTFIPAPTISFIVQGTALAQVAMNGTNLATLTSITFNGQLVTNYTINSATSVSLTIPEGAAKTGSVVVTGPGGVASYAYTIPAPVVTQVTDTSFQTAVLVGPPNKEFIIFFSHARAITSVATVPNLGPVTITQPLALFPNTSVYYMKVVPNVEGQYVIRFTNDYGYADTPILTTYAAPTIVSVSPNYGLPGDTITVTGTNLNKNCLVNFTTASGFTGATTSNVTATSMTVTVPIGAATGLLYVSNVGGTATSSSNFIVDSPPTITSFTPTTGHAISNPIAVTINGTGFHGIAGVDFATLGGGYAPASLTSTTSTQIKVLTPDPNSYTLVNGYIRVRTNHGSAISAALFRPTEDPLAGVEVPEPPACPAPWVPITLWNGEKIPAGLLAVGDRVLTTHESTGEFKPYVVEAVSRTETSLRLRLFMDDGRELAFSPGHRFKVGAEWIEVAKLGKGMLIDGTRPGRVDRVVADHSGPVIKITIKDAHTYETLGLLSHNAKNNPLPP